MKPAAQLVALKTLALCEIRRFMRIWVQTLLPPVITTALYFVIFGQFIGEQLDAVSGFPYIDYIVPGLILMAAITNAYANVVSSFYSAKFQRNIEEMLISPMPNYVILLGFMAGGIVRGVTVGVIVFLVSMFFTTLPFHSIVTAGIILLLTTTLFSLAGLINGIYAESFDDISIIPTFVLTPLTYLGGIFYSISLLPEFWRQVSLLNPILYMVNGFRHSILGVADIGPGLSILIISIFILLLASVSLFLLNRGTGIRR